MFLIPPTPISDEQDSVQASKVQPSSPAPVEPSVAQVDVTRRWARGWSRALAISLGVSFVLHLGAGLWMEFGAAEVPEASFEFESSRGIAMLATIGNAPPSVVDDSFGEVDLEQSADEEEPVEEEPVEEEPVEEEPVEEEPVEEEPVEEEPVEEEPVEEEPVEEEPVVVERTRPEPREQEQSEETPDEATEPEVRAESDATDTAQETPPRARPGTVNPAGSDVGVWGPEGAIVTAIFRNDRLVESGYDETVGTLFSALPDWENLVAGADIDIFAETSAMLIASSDPRYMNRTFMAAVHELAPAEIMQRLSTGYPRGVDWESRDGRVFGEQANPRMCGSRPCDPRMFVLPTENLFIFSRPEFVDDMLRGAPRARGLDGAEAWIDDQEAWLAENGIAAGLVEPEWVELPELELEEDPDLERRGPRGRAARARRAQLVRRHEAALAEAQARLEAQQAEVQALRDAWESQESRRRRRARRNDEVPPPDEGWVRSLLAMGNFADDEDDLAVVITLNRIARMRFSGMGSVQGPSSIFANVYASDRPEMRARLVFEDEEAARAFVDRWDSILGANRLALGVAGLYRPLSDAEWSFEGAEAHMTFRMERAGIERLAATLSMLAG